MPILLNPSDLGKPDWIVCSWLVSIQSLPIRKKWWEYEIRPIRTNGDRGTHLLLD